MSLNVSYNQNISSRGIDAKALREVTQEIFKRAESRSSSTSNLDFTKFQKPELGMDLYNGGIDADTARKVSMTNSGMQVALNENALASLRFLNSEASKSIFKSVEGKVAPAVSEEAPKTQNVFQLPGFNKLVKASDLGQDKRGSNPFYKGELQQAVKKEKEEQLNIFA